MTVHHLDVHQASWFVDLKNIGLSQHTYILFLKLLLLNTVFEYKIKVLINYKRLPNHSNFCQAITSTQTPYVTGFAKIQHNELNIKATL